MKPGVDCTPQRVRQSGLINWHTAPQDTAITRGADSSTQAGTAKEVALTLMGDVPSQLFGVAVIDCC